MVEVGDILGMKSTAPAEKESTEKSSWETDREDNKADDDHCDDDSGHLSSLPLTKQELLSCVRVLTLGSHHRSACSFHCWKAAEYLTNLEVLRIVETPQTQFETQRICQFHGSTCSLVEVTRPRKIVVRNVSQCSLPFKASWRLSERTKEVVFVFPTKADRYDSATVSLHSEIRYLS